MAELEELITSPGINEDIARALNPNIKSIPSGTNAISRPISLPSSDIPSAQNFILGIPNHIFIQNPGKNYFFNSSFNYKCGYPRVFIQNYTGTPVPVLDRKSGEMVAILTNPASWGTNPIVGINIIPDESCIGISTDDPSFDINVGYVFIQNTGRNFNQDVEIEFYDRDKEEVNGEAKAVVIEGRIVEIQIINSGTGFKRIPKIRIKNNTRGVGVKLYPIMKAVKRDTTEENAKPFIDSVQLSFCPSKNQVNALQPGDTI